MIDEDGLNVWYEDRLVGYLWRNEIDYIGFRYDDDWLQTDGFAISRTLPLQTDDFPETASVAHRFFANLLPEGGAREHVVRDLKIANTDFDLLRAIGGECAGALSVLGVENLPSIKHNYQPLEEREFQQLVTRRGQLYANQPPETRPRLSLAGAQDKCAVLYSREAYFNPIGDAPSTHILKFESQDYKNLPLYEVFTTRLAGAIDLPVVDIDLCYSKSQSFARVVRYDRYTPDVNHDELEQGGHIRRLHQEDFCQALGFAHTRKYQHDGGPEFRQCLELVREASDDPAHDSRLLLLWQIFNVLAGNSDGHAKNLSLLYSPDGGVRLTPFYDLICTRAIERIDSNLAFDVGGQRNPAAVTRDDWLAFAQRCDVGAKYFTGLLDDTAARLIEQLSGVREEFEDSDGSVSAVERIERIVKKQCKNVLGVVN